jgi:hypothetical protein
MPNPALAVDGHWELIDANDALAPLVQGAAADLMDPPVNVLRLSLHPDGAAPRIVNLGQWRQHVLGRVRRQADRTGDAFLGELLDELRGYPGDGTGAYDPAPTGADDVVVPLRMRRGGGELSFLSTTTVFGSPLDITVAEMAIEQALQQAETSPGGTPSGSAAALGSIGPSALLPTAARGAPSGRPTRRAAASPKRPGAAPSPSR